MNTFRLSARGLACVDAFAGLERISMRADADNSSVCISSRFDAILYINNKEHCNILRSR